MMKDIIDSILQARSEYKREAYYYVARAIESLHDKIREEENRRRHISGRELVDGMISLAKEDYGYLAYAVFEEWGIRTTEDIGTIVFLMVEEGILAAQSSDSKKDFKDVCDLKKAFEEEYRDFSIE